ncbi:hypothetical protein [Streptomyces chiangmaiensis]|uniref:Uncharacterized protein n=1 Tax=Streptomyces chiangmaiensis TaxID=766497 RepID=A0ABU7FXE3_9ACTN|nr:hypothetical protein [Streptomyces chiangmaiensis]MED7828615.1 hypothetical protein [Streptomyces chiangmaiensis]
MPIGSLENLLGAISEQATRGLRAIVPHGGVGHAQRNAAQAAAAACAERRERDAVATWLAERDLPGAPRR